MNEREQDSVFQTDSPKQMAGAIANNLADVYTQLHDLKRGVGQGLENAFMGIANDVSGLQAQVMQVIEQTLMEACNKTAQTQAQIPHMIEQQLGAVGGTLNLIDSRLAQNRKRLQRLQGPTIKGTADAVGPGEVQTPQSAVPFQAPGPSTQAPGQTPGASLLQNFQPFPPAPSAPELQTLVMPTATPGSMIGLAQLPPQIWDRANDMGIFLSTAPTPLTQGQIAIQNDENGQFVDAGHVFLNLAQEAARPQLQTLIQTLGVPQSAVIILSPQDAYNAAVSVFSEPVVQSTYSVYNLPLPPVQQAPQTMPPISSQPPPPIIETSPPPDHRPPPPTHSPTSTPTLPQGECPQPPCPKIEFTGLTDLTDWLLPRLRVPTMDEACAAINPLYDWLGMPQPLRIPCTSVAEIWRFMNGRVPNGDS